ncbi:hypothetical protein AV530_005624 [Patagioenas fasciata monilis]|uniref:Uncharacterized protein n=1 Tax=Patagioenas fasciata monilis TaxID=372326 RepID=A0A1V4JM27_PATFA|nr:hypothetical protein AV530_005624 [Patagioenas fasciata monilis]
MLSVICSTEPVCGLPEQSAVCDIPHLHHLFPPPHQSHYCIFSYSREELLLLPSLEHCSDPNQFQLLYKVICHTGENFSEALGLMVALSCS